MDNNIRIQSLLDKCEAMAILSSRANEYWGLIKTIFQIPLILTGSVMCILNSFDDGKTADMKIPNVIVNGLSVLLISYQNQLKVAEKVETFKSLSNNFLLLAHQIEGLEPDEIDRNMVNNLTDKYDTFVMSCEFRDIPKKYKLEVRKIMKGKTLPLQLNGGSGLVDRSSNEIIMSNIGTLSEVV
jgi:hypothetical protein